MRLFIAGATGATGTVLVPLAEKAGFDLALHVRPGSKDRSPLGRDPRAKIFELDDHAALVDALAGTDVCITLIGTMRSRFERGDTYESSDVGSARALASAAKEAGVPRLLLLSSVGAGGVGAYLKMKGECERIVKESGLGWTIFRPSAFESPAWAPSSTHGKRKSPPLFGAMMKAVGVVPGLRGISDDYRPIGLDVLARAILAVAAKPKDGCILQGRELHVLGAETAAA